MVGSTARMNPFCCLMAVLMAVQYVQVPATVQHSFGPHSPPPTKPWFEGWYSRIQSGSASFALLLGHFPGQHLDSPSAACALLIHTQGTKTLQHFWAPMHSFNVQNSFLPTHDPIPTFALHTSNAQDYCYYNFSGASISMEGRIGGAYFKLQTPEGADLYHPPDRLAWARDPKSSPEGWAARLDFLAKLSWDVYSLSTPVSFSYMPPSTSSTMAAHGAHAGAGDTQATDSSTADGMDSTMLPGSSHSGTGSAIAFGSTPVAVSSTMLSVSDQAGTGSTSSTGTTMPLHAHPVSAAGGTTSGVTEHNTKAWQTPHSITPSNTDHSTIRGTGRLHLEKNWGTSFPGRWLWAEGQITSKGDPSELPQAAFVLAGGDLLTFLSPPAPAVHTYAFSFHDNQDTIVTIGPDNPAIDYDESLDHCQGKAQLKLYSAVYVVAVDMQADFGSFAWVVCPTDIGFKEDSVESFTATAHIQIYKRKFPLAPLSVSEKIVDVTFKAAALEFGGSYVCTSLTAATSTAVA